MQQQDLRAGRLRRLLRHLQHGHLQLVLLLRRRNVRGHDLRLPRRVLPVQRPADLLRLSARRQVLRRRRRLQVVWLQISGCRAWLAGLLATPRRGLHHHPGMTRYAAARRGVFDPFKGVDTFVVCGQHGAMRHVVIALALVVLAGCSKKAEDPAPLSTSKGTSNEESGSLADARRGFQTKLLRTETTKGPPP